MNKNWFRQLLFSYLPAFFGITMILFFLFFQTLNEQNRKEAIKANEFLSQQVIRYSDNTLKLIDYRVVREILTNPVVSRFFAPGDNDVYANMQALKVMDDIKFNYPIIDSVYFVRLKDNYVLGDGSSALSDFPDLQFIDQYKNKKMSDKWTGERDYKAYANVAPKKVITLVRAVPYSGQKQGFFVVNVSLSNLKNSISQMYNSNISFVRLVDNQGHNLLGNDKGAADKNEVFSQFTSPYTGWKVESGLISKGGIKFALNFYSVWVILAFAAVILGVIWVIHVTRRNYQPIQQIVSLIQTNSLKNETNGKKSEGEFGFIQNTLVHLMEETEKFRMQNQKNLILQKKYRFQEVMEGNAPIKESEWISELKKYDLQVEGKTAFVQSYEMDGYQNFTQMYSQHDQSLLKFTLFIVVLETAQNHNAAVWAEWTADNRLSSIIWAPEDSDPGEIQVAIAESVRGWIEQNLSFTVTIGQGDSAETLEEIRQSYEKAGDLLQFKAVLGPNRIICPEDSVRPPQNEINEYFYTIYSLSQSLRLSDDEWTRHLSLLFEQIRSSLSSRKEVKSLMQFLQQHLEREFLELSKEYRHIWKSTQGELLGLGKQWETVDELEAGCTRIFETMYNNMHALRDSYSNRAVIGDIRNYIEENFANPDLSLDYLSEKFQLNAKNVSKMFKEEFGENFVDFLIGLRMNSAKRMLTETHKSMQEISLEVGYYNYNSFNRAFKNVVGLSPRDYRKQGSESA
ncbi:AraC family transcriptional regulator [Paenibacillus sp. sptzw28]|uniref:AraC family transcriptional regulator n=1 Tax=Paenibacillus sp. sptzw28 TaxID=715179 RepID=UPI001C6EAC89|nr:AraC family transcriptional regulator [Paenibacillus sp. sptzw28]QYR22963.1 AraC family transcriptional regulator [Paenibacillus sp. sptzw28]